MPRRNRARRFEPRYGVSQATLDVEAGYLTHEADDYSVFAPSDLDAKRIERHANGKHCWEHLQKLLESLGEQDQRIIHCLFFRDIHQLLELYLTYIRPKVSSAPTASLPLPKRNKPESAYFNEWLFDLETSGKEKS